MDGPYRTMLEAPIFPDKTSLQDRSSVGGLKRRKKALSIYQVFRSVLIKYIGSRADDGYRSGEFRFDSNYGSEEEAKLIAYDLHGLVLDECPGLIVVGGAEKIGSMYFPKLYLNWD